MNRKERRLSGHPGTNKVIEKNQKSIESAFKDANKNGIGLMKINAFGEIEHIHLKDFNKIAEKDS